MFNARKATKFEINRKTGGDITTDISFIAIKWKLYWIARIKVE
jgi:hypothetical protein